MQWNTTQPKNGTKLDHLQEMWMALETIIQSELSQKETN